MKTTLRAISTLRDLSGVAVNKTMAIITIGLLFVATSAFSPVASAEVITFDDVTTDNYVAIENGYHGLNWDMFYILNSGNESGTGYANGLVSGANVAFNGYDAPASFSSDIAFTLGSIDITKAWNNGITHFAGYVGDTLTYQMDVFSTTAGPTLAVFNWAGVNKVVMSDGDQSEHTAIDNLTIGAVPEPGTYLLMLAGLGLMGLMFKHRRNA